MPETTQNPIEVPAPGSHTWGFSFALEICNNFTPPRLSLRAQHRPGFGAISIDWTQADIQRRIAAGKRQPMARAVGLHKAASQQLHILDATAGLGRDGYVMAALGARTTLAERNPSVMELLRDAHQRALNNPAQIDIAKRIDLLALDSSSALQNQRNQDVPYDVIYLDPMYPEDGKSALPSKEMQILRDLTNGDQDADSLLPLALKAARLRVVVKRPSKAPWLAGREPSMSLQSTQLRFDVYVIAAQSEGHESSGKNRND